MKIKLEPLTAEHLIEIHNLGAVERHLGADQIIDNWQTYQNGPAFVSRDEYSIICAGGVINMWDGVGEGWAMLTPRAKGMTVVRLFRDTFRLIEIAHNYHRIQASVRADFDAGIRFATWLGFKSEGVMKNYDASKNDFIRMAKVGS